MSVPAQGGGHAPGKYLINSIYRDMSPEALQELNDYLSSINPINVSMGNIRGFQTTGAMVVVERKELTADAASFDFQNITQNFKHLRLLIYLRSAAGGTLNNAHMRFNNDTAANYWTQYGAGNAGAAIAGEVLGFTSMETVAVPAGTGGNAGFYGAAEALIPFYSSGNRKSFVCTNYVLFAKTTGGQYATVKGGAWDSTAAINRITLFAVDGSNFSAGSVVTLYAQN